MSNPVLVEVTRGGMVESRHHGAFAICDARGGVVASAGDIEAPVFPRSSVKALQALPLVERGWAESLGLDDAELALACASHSGEPIHVETAERMLGKAGRGVADLECGAHWPLNRDASRDLTRAGRKPSALHNNCSGKHGGFLCLACGLKQEARGYIAPDHPVQRTVSTALSELYGVQLREPGIDGCSIPTYAAPLRAIAHAFARFVTGIGLDPDRANAAARLRKAVAAHPLLVAGHGRLDTILGDYFGIRAFTKTGAEGVFCAAFPDQGLGLALKCEDGATRASEAILLRLMECIMGWTETDRAALAPQIDPVMRNWNGLAVGEIRATPAAAVRI